MSGWMQGVAVATGAAAGALLRWRTGVWLNPAMPQIPLGTLAVNCVGGLLAGVALVAFARLPNEMARLLLVTGFLGGLTTFSTFSAESLLLIQRQRWDLALLHSGLHLLGALGCAALGSRLARFVLG